MKKTKPNESSNENNSNDASKPESDDAHRNLSPALSLIAVSESIEPIVTTSESQIAQTSAKASEQFDIEAESKQCIERFDVRDKNNVKLNYVRCKTCIAFPNIVKLHTDNNKPPPITTNEGTRYRTEYVTKHLESKSHKHTCARGGGYFDFTPR